MFIFKTIVWGTIFLVIALMVGPWFATQFDSSFPAISLGKLRIAGAILMAIGIPLALYCTASIFIPGKSRPAPYDAGGIFTIAGPYCYIRNPFMLGVLLSLWGEALFMSRIAMFAYAFIATWCIHFWVIFFEEPALQERFGDEYRAYREKVPRWIPRLDKYQPAKKIGA